MQASPTTPQGRSCEHPHSDCDPPQKKKAMVRRFELHAHPASVSPPLCLPTKDDAIAKALNERLLRNKKSGTEHTNHFDFVTEPSVLCRILALPLQQLVIDYCLSLRDFTCANEEWPLIGNAVLDIDAFEEAQRLVMPRSTPIRLHEFVHRQRLELLLVCKHFASVFGDLSLADPEDTLPFHLFWPSHKLGHPTRNPFDSIRMNVDRPMIDTEFDRYVSNFVNSIFNPHCKTVSIGPNVTTGMLVWIFGTEKFKAIKEDHIKNYRKEFHFFQQMSVDTIESDIVGLEVMQMSFISRFVSCVKIWIDGRIAFALIPESEIGVCNNTGGSTMVLMLKTLRSTHVLLYIGETLGSVEPITIRDCVPKHMTATSARVPICISTYFGGMENKALEPVQFIHYFPHIQTLFIEHSGYDTSYGVPFSSKQAKEIARTIMYHSFDHGHGLTLDLAFTDQERDNWVQSIPLPFQNIVPNEISVIGLRFTQTLFARVEEGEPPANAFVRPLHYVFSPGQNRPRSYGDTTMWRLPFFISNSTGKVKNMTPNGTFANGIQIEGRAHNVNKLVEVTRHELYLISEMSQMSAVNAVRW